MSGTIISVIAQLLALFLPMVGVRVGDDQLTGTIQTLVIVVTGLVIWYKRTKLQKAPDGAGDVGLMGGRKQ